MPEKGSLLLIKNWIKKIPGIQVALRIRYKFQQDFYRKRELSSLVYQDNYVLFSLPRMMQSEVPLIRKMILDEVSEWLELYGSIRLRKKTIKSTGAPAGSVLLYMPQAILKIPNSHEEYLANLKRQSRYLIRKAENLGYIYREFSWNEHLEDIYEINTSKEARQGEPMRGWYGEPVQPRNWSTQESRYLKNYGAFKDNKLRAYIFFLISENFSFTKHIIGHGDFLNDGLMNGLISFVVNECIAKTEIRYIEYGRYKEGSSLDAFKKHIGFTKHAIILDLSGQQELLKQARRNIKSIWSV